MSSNSSMCVGVCALSCFSHARLFEMPWTVNHKVPLFLGLSRQEYWSGLPYPSPEDPPDPETEPMSLMSPAPAGRFFITSVTWVSCTAGRFFTPKQQFLLFGTLVPKTTV